MLSNIWNMSVRGDKLMADKPQLFGSTSPPRSPLCPISQLPLFNKMKRKRDESSQVAQNAGQPLPKRRPETLCHVQIPPSVTTQFAVSVPTPPEQAGLPNNHSNQTLNSPNVNLTENSFGGGKAPASVPYPSMETKTSETGRSNIDLQSQFKQVADISGLREAIETQFNLEILLKHRELRLIDQEMAKCQVALEQLRRCQVIPYPTSSVSAQNMQSSLGEYGLAYSTNNAPEAPAWGVTDGPYTRHFERWLLQDPVFDDSYVEPPTPSSTVGKTLPERSTRGSKVERTPVASVSRAQRGSKSRLTASSQGHPESKEEKGPMIVRRATDGHMVKLVCLDCRRSDFSSTQGFINHCRIAHTRQFLSHDAAIEASGEELDADEGNAVDGNLAKGGPTSAGLVHPLIRSAHLLQSANTNNTTTTTTTTTTEGTTHVQKKKKTISKALPSSVAAPSSQPLPVANNRTTLLHPSPQTPHLSALFAKLGRQVDLEALVVDATTRSETNPAELSDYDVEEDSVEEEQVEDRPQSRSTRGVIRGGVAASQYRKPNRNSSSRSYTVGYDGSVDAPPKPAYPEKLSRHQPYTSPFNAEHADDSRLSTVEMNTPSNLSPNTTDPHPAPSLVSDDGDHETTHSDSEGLFSADEDDRTHHYLDSEMMEHDSMVLDDANGLRLGGTTAKSQHHTHPQPRQSTASTVRRPRASAMAHHGHPHHGQRHVSFTSPNRGAAIRNAPAGAPEKL